jgi:hypothetical protein
MKTFKNKYLRIQLSLIVLILTFSCINLSELKSPIDGLKILINYDIFDTFVSFRFVDSATGELIGGTGTEKVKVVIKGSSAQAIVDQLGNHKESYESVFGLLSLALNPKDPWVPSTQNKLSFLINATSGNYKAVNLNLQVAATGKLEYRVMMEKTAVDASGIKKYLIPLGLNENGELKENFTYRSSGSEALITIKQGTQFLNSSGVPDKSSSVNLIFTAYSWRDAAPIPGGLLGNIILKDQTVQTSAVDIFRAVNVQIINKASEVLTVSSGNPVILRYKIDNNAYNPKTKAAIIADTQVQTYTWLPKTGAWQLNDAVKLQSDTLGYFVESPITTPGLYTAGMHINVSPLNGQLSFQVPGTFPSYPVPTGVYLYRLDPWRYIGGIGYDVPDKGYQKTIDFKVPENTPVRFYIWNNSNANSFVAKPDFVDSPTGGGSFGTVATTLTSTAAQVTGKVKVNIGGGFATDEFMVQASLLNSPNGGAYWSQQYKISKTSNTFDIAASLPANTTVYLQIQSVDNSYTFASVPANYSMVTSSAKGLSWEFTVNPMYIQANFNFTITRNADLPRGDYTVKGVLTNMDTKGNEGEFVFQVKEGQTAYSAKMNLSKLIRYQLNLKRVDGTPEYLVYPYEFEIGNITQKDYAYTCELSNSVKKPVAIKLKVVCKKSEVIPTLHGYYRTVWEDQWKECDIVNGAMTITCEMGATYIVGLMVDGKMESTTYKIDGTSFDFNFNLGDADCAKMGW